MKNVINPTTFSQKILLMFIFFPMLLSSSCKKEQPENPLTNVVRCKINGVPWESLCEGDIIFGCSAVDCRFDISKLDIILTAIKKMNSIDQVIYLESTLNSSLKDTLKTKEFVWYDKSLKDNCKHFFINSKNNYNITITKIDSIKQADRLGTIYGKFEFTAKNTCGDTIRVTDGYFRTGYIF